MKNKNPNPAAPTSRPKTVRPNEIQLTPEQLQQEQEKFLAEMKRQALKKKLLASGGYKS
jgi:hypothetical protein